MYVPFLGSSWLFLSWADFLVLVFMSATSLSSLSVLPRVLRPFLPLPPLSGENEWLLSLPRLSVLWKKKIFVLAEQHIKDCRKTGKTTGKRHCVKSQIFMPEFARMPIGGASTENRGVLFDSNSPFSWSANLLLIQITERDQIVNMRYASVEILSYPHNKCRIH